MQSLLPAFPTSHHGTFLARHVRFSFNQSLQAGSGRASLQKKSQHLAGSHPNREGKWLGVGRPAGQVWSTGQQAWGLTLASWRTGRGPGLALATLVGRRGCTVAGRGRKWNLLGFPDVTSPAAADWPRASLTLGEVSGQSDPMPQSSVQLWHRGGGRRGQVAQQTD